MCIFVCIGMCMCVCLSVRVCICVYISPVKTEKNRCERPENATIGERGAGVEYHFLEFNELYAPS